MKGIIILNTADFSGNNIGRYAELSELTKKVLAKQTQYGEDSDEAVALNAFLTNLTSGGFIGGDSPLLKTMFIPGLADAHGELLYDIASLDASGYPTDRMNETEKDASSPVFVLYEKNGKNVGVERVQGTSATGSNRLSLNVFETAPSNTPYPTFSVVMFAEAAPASSALVLSNISSLAKIRLSSASFLLRYGQEDVLTTAHSSDLSGFSGISYLGSTGFEALLDNGAVGATTLVDASKLVYVGDPNTFNLCDAMNAGPYHIGFFAIGNYINSTKMAELKGYVSTLMTALHFSN